MVHLLGMPEHVSESVEYVLIRKLSDLGVVERFVGAPHGSTGTQRKRSPFVYLLPQVFRLSRRPLLSADNKIDLVSHTHVLFVQNPSSIYTDLPDSAEALRSTLARVNLRTWLPSLLCPSPVVKGEAATTSSTTIDHTWCHEVVEASLATQPHVEITFKTSHNSHEATSPIR